MRKKRGFTLMEMLIVVAIIAILIAIAIPLFANQLERSREATCLANRRSLVGELKASQLLGESDAEISAAFTAGLKTFTCPSGGTFTLRQDVNTRALTIVCSKHGNQDPVSSITSGLDAIRDAFENGVRDETGKLVNIWDKGSHRIDSTAPDGVWTKYFEKALEDAGIDLSAMGVAYWAVLQNGDKNNVNWTSYLWTGVDISTLKPNTDSVPTVRYDPATGKYYVKSETVKQDSGGYNVLCKDKQTEAGGFSANTTTCDSFEDAQKEYNKLMAEYNKNN